MRLSDHTALAEATEKAEKVLVVFVYDTTILDALEDRDDRRLTFIHASLAELDANLRRHGSRLVTLHGDPVQVIPELAQRLGVEAVFANRDTEPAAVRRDDAVARALAVPLLLSKDQVVFEGLEVAGPSGEPYRVFTPYGRAWRARLTAADAAPREPDLSRLWPASELTPGQPHSLAEVGFAQNSLWLTPGERGAQSRLEAMRSKLPEYGERRDFPAQDATSGLSVHLRFGTISARACVRTALADPSAGADKWLSELIWREFYQMILAVFPHVEHRAFKPEFDQIEWPGSPEHLEAWQAGNTGYPLVDAAMRCFNATGWMHNRLRMVVASFLVKDLLVDWREGERYFARKLLDFDLASNNGGWQWAASTGVDAQPYFRIFNPVLQSRKFDPDGTFIQRWVPEAGALDPHEPVRPIVDHAQQKAKAIALLEGVRRLS